jgi:type I restriction enzyme S subunit
MSTETTHIETEKQLVPALRFKEFEGDFQKKKVGDIAELTSSKRVYLNDYVDVGIPFYRGKEITELRAGKTPDDILYITESSYNEFKSKYGVPQKDDILITAVGTLGNVLRIKNDDKFYFKDGNLIWFRKIKENSNYLEIALEYYKRAIDKTSIGSTQRALTMVELRKLKFPFPSLSEQQKIASFLSAVDEKIQQLTKKKELLEQYKKGVMQQLFSGLLRFKDENGNPYPYWDWVGGNELFDNISDKKHNSDLPILAITQDQGAIPRELINYKMTVTEASVASYKVVQKGDFIISLRTFQGGIEFSEYHGICSPAYNILRPSSEEVDRAFYKFYLKTSFYIRQLQKNLEGIRDGKMISYKYFSEIKVPFPSNPEQQKIATYLSSIDTKTERVNNQITQTQAFKKGLLQQMFVAA